MIFIPSLNVSTVNSSNQAKNTLFLPCPNTPNCVSSKSKLENHYIKPLPLTNNAAKSWQQLVDTVLSYPRVNIVTRQKDYFHVTFTSTMFRFVDDVEFLLDENENVIHMRSASRIGYYDFGANRRRLEDIRRNYNATSDVTFKSS